jgi:hypothetical protein
MMPKLMHGTAAAVACLLLALGCDGGTIVDDWPTYEVRGIVRTAGGAPVPSALVELETYSEPDCGTKPLFAYSRANAGLDGRYRVRQDEIAGVLSGCLRLVAHPDTGVLSQPTAVADLPVNNVQVIEGETVFTVDLTLP